MEEERSAAHSVAPATTEEVLGRPDHHETIPEQWKHSYRKLSSLREEFLRHKSDLKADAAEEVPTFSTHMADAATDTYDRDWALGMLSSEQNALYEIEHALARIRLGRYGICEATGQPIPKERLEAIPWARFTVEAERAAEEEGQGDHASLGEIRAVPRVSVRQAEKELQKEENAAQQAEE